MADTAEAVPAPAAPVADAPADSGAAPVPRIMIRGLGPHVKVQTVSNALSAAGVAHTSATKPRRAAFVLVEFDSPEQKAAALAALEGGIPHKSKVMKWRDAEDLTGHDAFRARRAQSRGANAREQRREMERAALDEAARAAAAERSVHEIVTPWLSHAYSSQLAAKSKMILGASRRVRKKVFRDSVRVLTTRTKRPAVPAAEAPELVPLWAKPRNNPDERTDVQPCVPSPVRLEYRNKASLTFTLTPGGRVACGFRAGTFSSTGAAVVDCVGATNLHPLAKRVSVVMKQFLASSPFQPYSLGRHTGVWRSVVIRQSSSHPDLQVIVCSAPPQAIAPSSTWTVAQRQALAVAWGEALPAAPEGSEADAGEDSEADIARMGSLAPLREQVVPGFAALSVPTIANSSAVKAEFAEAVGGNRVVATAVVAEQQAEREGSEAEASSDAGLPAALAALTAEQLAGMYEADLQRLKTMLLAELPSVPALVVPETMGVDASVPDLSEGPKAGHKRGRDGSSSTPAEEEEDAEPSVAPAEQFPGADDAPVSVAASDVFSSMAAADARVTSLWVEENDSVSNAGGDGVLRLLAGEKTFRQSLCNTVFHVSPAAFLQTNIPGAERLYEMAREWAGLGPRTLLLDVCCGTGTIGLSLVGKDAGPDSVGSQVPADLPRLIGVEIIESAVEDARENAKLNGISRTEFFANKAEAVLPAITTRVEEALRGAPDSVEVVAVVDPPRSGLHPSVLRTLRSCKVVSKIVYVSCNPSGSLVADSVALCTVSGGHKSSTRGAPFALRKLVAMDMFPNTPHCEGIALFDRCEDP